MSDQIVGIDLGTTNSAVAVWCKGDIEIVKENDSELLPSYVGLTPEGRLIVGEEARNQYLLYPERTVRSIKRKMGSNEMSRLGDKEYSPPEISGMILRELKNRAERHLRLPVQKAVITVPAYFSDAQRQATRDAGSIAGLEVVRIINEPTAACLAYEAHHHTAATIVLAFDLGGGTFDVSIVNIDGDLVEVMASHGDTQLGGDDFDELIYERLLEHLSDEGETPAEPDSVSANRLRRAAEEGKIRLSDEVDTLIVEDNLRLADGTREHLEYELGRSELDDLITPLLRKTLDSVRKAMADAGKKPSDIEEIVLVGGSTRLPFVADLLQEELGLSPRRDVHPDLAVAYGAGVMAARLAGREQQRILVDITPYTFGTSAIGYVNDAYCTYKFCPIIHSGTPLPVSKTRAFATVIDGQEAIDVMVFEGDNPDARQNILIGRFQVDGLSEDAAAGSTILLHMDLDLDGILRVRATEKDTGLSKDVVIDGAMEKLSGEALVKARAEVRELLGDDAAPLFTPGDADIPVGAEEDATADGDSEPVRDAWLMQRRLKARLSEMDEADGEDAEELDARLMAALATDNTEELGRVVREMEDLLFYLESGE